MSYHVLALAVLLYLQYVCVGDVNLLAVLVAVVVVHFSSPDVRRRDHTKQKATEK